MKTQRTPYSRVLNLLGALSLICGGAVQADSFPDRPPRMVVPFSAGGISDFIARVIAERIQPHLGAALIIENRPGASGNIGMDLVAKSAPDGYVMGLASVGFASNSVLKSRIPFDPIKDFVPVVMVGFVPSVITVHPSVPVNSVKEFIDLAKRHPEELVFGSSGLGTGSHLAVELFKYATGTRMTHVPYKSTAQAIPDLLAGRIQFMFDFPTTAIQPIRAGKLKGLAVTSAQRSSELPDLPTVSEAGVNGYEFATWFGILTAAGVPAPVVEKLAVGLTRTLEAAATRTRMSEQAIEIAPMPSRQFAAYLRTDIERWKKMLNQGHLAKLD